MPRDETGTADGLLRLLAEELAERVAEHLAPPVAELLLRHPAQASSWLTTSQAIAYTGHFPKACGLRQDSMSRWSHKDLLSTRT